ncbi:MAG: nucleoside kinase, partial [Eubacteriales bacterium]|nr:nucleoside kinase [Eubacteriales bacterium]
MNELSLIINGSKEKKYPDNISLLEISKDFHDEYQTPIIVAMVDGNLKDLTYVLNSSKNNCRIDFFDLTSELGNKVYQRSLIFLLIVAAKEIFPRAKLTIENSLSQGIYCKIKIDPALTRKELLKIENRMKEYVEKDLPFTKKVLPTQEVIDLYNNHDMEDKALLLQQLKNPVSSVYYLGSKFGYFYRTMVPSTKYLSMFDLKFYPPGFILRFPAKNNPHEIPDFIENPKLAKVFTETRRWAKIIECNYISSLNEYIKNNEINNIIKISEALHEKKISQIADTLVQNEDLKLICIAGPSSSGKTTFTKRLSIQLQVIGYKTELLSIDDYFIDAKDRPLGPDGSPDFESLDIVDIDLFQNHLQRFFDGEEIEIPKYDFISGTRSSKGEKIKLDPREILIIEGIHGLNEKLTSSIYRKNKAKIYINAL